MENLQRQFDLPTEDQLFLNDYGLPWETIVDGSHWVLIHNFATDERYNHPKVTAAIRLEAGYPRAGLDMVYFFPALVRADGKLINRTEGTQVIANQTFQRWSRHRTSQNPWIIGQDNIGTHIVLIEDWLAREFER